MGRIATLRLCFILALLTVLSVTPAFLLFCACELDPACLARSFGNFLVGPLGVRKPAVAILLAPLVVLVDLCRRVSQMPPTPGRTRFR